MDETQEIILDHLVAAERIGTTWAPGPLQLAVEALQSGGLTRRRDVQKILGFPTPFCAGVEGASEPLRNLEDVRTLAITLFSEVPPREQSPTLKAVDHVRIALWSARQAYLLYNAPQALCEEVGALIEDNFNREQMDWDRRIEEFNQQFERALARIQLGREAFHPTYLLLTTFYFAMHTARRVWLAKPAADNTDRTCRSAGRLSALAGGLDGAVAFCLALARETGL